MYGQPLPRLHHAPPHTSHGDRPALPSRGGAAASVRPELCSALGSRGSPTRSSVRAAGISPPRMSAPPSLQLPKQLPAGTDSEQMMRWLKSLEDAIGLGGAGGARIPEPPAPKPAWDSRVQAMPRSFSLCALPPPARLSVCTSLV